MPGDVSLQEFNDFRLTGVTRKQAQQLIDDAVVLVSSRARVEQARWVPSVKKGQKLAASIALFSSFFGLHVVIVRNGPRAARPGPRD